ARVAGQIHARADVRGIRGRAVARSAFRPTPMAPARSFRFEGGRPRGMGSAVQALLLGGRRSNLPLPFSNSKARHGVRSLRPTAKDAGETAAGTCAPLEKEHAIMISVTTRVFARQPPGAAFAIGEERWDAVVRRDAKADGTFYYSVLTTGVYCRPSCP